MAELQAVFHLNLAKTRKIKDLNPAEEDDFPCKFWWLGPSEVEFCGE